MSQATRQYALEIVAGAWAKEGFHCKHSPKAGAG